MATIAMAGGLCLQPLAAQATVLVSVDLTRQRMHVTSASGSYDWPISSAAAGYITPPGTYAVQSLERMHYSRLYHMSPMPYSIFFAGGYAIHGTYATGALGRPASHGCVRLAPGNAATLFSLVQSEGASISISGSPPPSARLYEARHRTRPRAYAAGSYGQSGYGSAGYSQAAYGYDASSRPAAYGAQTYAVQPLFGAFPF